MQVYMTPLVTDKSIFSANGETFEVTWVTDKRYFPVQWLHFQDSINPTNKITNWINHLFWNRQ